MKKLSFLFALMLLGAAVKAQTISTVLDESSSTYFDMKVLSGNTHIAGLRQGTLGAVVDVLLNNGTDLQHITGSIALPLGDNIYKQVQSVTNNFAFAVGSKLQPVKIINGVPQLLGQETTICESFIDAAIWNGFLFVAGYNVNNKLFIIF